MVVVAFFNVLWCDLEPSAAGSVLGTLSATRVFSKGSALRAGIIETEKGILKMEKGKTRD